MRPITLPAAGLRLLLDFHYSDYWADPGKQVIPADWLSCTTSDEMAEKVSEYTKEVLQAMKDAGAAPNMIQIGNEISSGMLLHKEIHVNQVSGAETGTPASDAVSGVFKSPNYFFILSKSLNSELYTSFNLVLILIYFLLFRLTPSNSALNFSNSFLKMLNSIHLLCNIFYIS